MTGTAGAADPLPEQVADINPGTDSSLPSELTVMNGELFFRASDGISGVELWKADGTSGAALVKDIALGASNSTPFGFTQLGDELFFAADDGVNGRELWKTDGTTFGTVMVADISPGSGDANPRGLAVLGNELLFQADDGVHGIELWKTDGTNGGTALVKDIQVGPGASTPIHLTRLGDELFFGADDRPHVAGLWKTDGTGQGTVFIRDLRPNGFTEFAGALYFGAFNGLWKTDGTTTTYVATSISAAWLTPFGGELFFTDVAARSGLWKTNGTAAGTAMVADLPGTALRWLTPVGGELLFAAAGELWKSDGTGPGTVLVKDIDPGLSESDPSWLTVFGGEVFFQADDGIHGDELWKSDGTTAGTVLVSDINPGESPGLHLRQFAHMTAMGEELFFRARNGLSGVELWRLPSSRPLTPSDTVGGVSPNGLWHLRRPNGDLYSFFYGNPGDVALLGDWDGDGLDTPGMYRPTNGFAYLTNDLPPDGGVGLGDPALTFFFGGPGDQVFVGDWDGDGIDTLGISRKGKMFLANTNATVVADLEFWFGTPTDVAFGGDPDGDGKESVFLYRPSSGFTYFTNSTPVGPNDVAPTDGTFFFGIPTDRFVIGDWDGDGTDTVGVFRPSDTTVYLRNSNTTGPADAAYVWGEPSWTPVAGHAGIVGDQPVTLSTDGLGVARFGDSAGQVMSALSARLGLPDADSGWILPDDSDVLFNCAADPDFYPIRGIRWSDLLVLFSAAETPWGAAGSEHFFSFYLLASDASFTGLIELHPEFYAANRGNLQYLTTPEGVGLGTTVSQLQAIYGDRLTLGTLQHGFGDTFNVDMAFYGVTGDWIGIAGYISGHGQDDTIVEFIQGGRGCTF